MDKQNRRTPQGELVMKTLAMPADTNANGDIFGGWALSQMDLGGGILAKTYSPYGRAATVAIENVMFMNPIKVGEVVSTFAKIIHFGRTSLKISIETWVYDYRTQISKIVTNGVFVYVSIDDSGKPVPLSLSTIQSPL